MAQTACGRRMIMDIKIEDYLDEQEIKEGRSYTLDAAATSAKGCEEMIR